jgi:hypothetical protein
MAGNRNNDRPHLSSHQQGLSGTPSRGTDLNNLSVLADWRHIPFLMVDSSKTKLLEDAVAARERANGKEWSTDLKIIHPIPFESTVSLKEGEPQFCLGIRDMIGLNGSRSPTVTLAVARNLTRVSDRQAGAILQDRERGITGIAGQNVPDPNLLDRIKSSLKAVRAAALTISDWRDRQLTPEHVMSILSTHAQSATIDASRKLEWCPTLIVLRHQGTRAVTDSEWKKRGVPYATKRGVSIVPVGKAVPTVLHPGHRGERFDSLRLKERSISGAINITQIACSLLRISPIPDEIVRQGVRPDSEADTWKRGGPLPEPLDAAIKERRYAIREVLSGLSVHYFGSPNR